MDIMSPGIIAGHIADFLYNILFFNIFVGSDKLYFPFLIAWLIGGCIYCNFRYKIKNIRYITKAALLLFSPKEHNKQIHDREKSILRQETSLSIVCTTIGSSVDIASMFGVILAIKTCGVGVLFWVIFGGFAATSIRFSEAFLGHRYRVISQDGLTYFGGPQIYIREIFKRHWAKFGIIMALFYNIAMAWSILPSPQLNQATNIVSHFFPLVANHRKIFSLFLCLFVVGITLGGFRRISTVIPKIVFLIAIFYAVFSAIIITVNLDALPALLVDIVKDAFSLKAGFGGLLICIATGLQRSFYSTEAGMGVAGIAHSNSINKNSIQEGLIATVSPIFSAIFLCVSSGLVTCLTGAQLIGDTDIDIMMLSFKSLHHSLHYVLIFIIPLSGLCTAINWAYYGIVSFTDMFGQKFVKFYAMLVFCCYYVSCIVEDFSAVLKLADVGNLSMGIPNLIAIYFATELIGAHLQHKTKAPKTKKQHS